MSFMKRVLSAALSVLMMATSFDASGLIMGAAAEGVEPLSAEPMMKFVQSEFDEDTSMLSMDLLVKPQSSTANTFIAEGAFTFSFDTNALVLCTDPSEYNEKSGKTAIPEYKLMTQEEMLVVGAPGSNTINSFTNASDGDYKGRRVNSEYGLSPMMSAYEYIDSYPVIGGDINEYELGDFGAHTGIATNVATGFVYSTKRGREASIGSKADSKGDVYFQYRFGDRIMVKPKVDSDGYAKVITFKFLVISEYDELGQPVPAYNMDRIFANSITVPEDAAEANEILNEFRFEDSTGTEVKLPLGAAAVKEMENIDDWRNLKTDTISYYYDTPRASSWSREWFRVDAWTAWGEGDEGYPADITVNHKNTPDDNKPYVSYDNCEKEYILEKVYAYNNNVISTQSSADFIMPADEASSARYPRYSVPTAEHQASWDEDEAGGDARWIPWVYKYTGSGSNKTFVYDKRSALKYELGTGVAGGSLTKPEIGDGSDEAFDEFLASFVWEISLDEDGVTLTDENNPYIDFDTLELTGDPVVIQTQQGEATAQRYKVTAPATVASSSGTQIANPYLHKTLQKVTYYEGQLNEYSEYLPVGVSFDMVESDISIIDMDGTRIAKKGLAPQLNIKSYASEKDSIAWAERNSANAGGGIMYLVASYVDPDSGEKKKAELPPIKLRLYKAGHIGTSIDINLAHIGTTSTEDGEVTGLTLAAGQTDKIKESSAYIIARVFDQYGIYFTEGSAPTLTLEQKAEDGGTGTTTNLPIKIVSVGSDITMYRLEYVQGKTANNVTGGYYEVHGKLGSISTNSTTKDERTFLINKEANILSLLRVSLAESAGVVEESPNVYTAEYTVPAYRPNATTDQTASFTSNIMELSNQWRDTSDVSQSSKIYEYDVVSGIRVNRGTAEAPIYDDFVSSSLAQGNGVTISATVALENPATMSWDGIRINNVAWSADTNPELGTGELKFDYTTKTKNGTVVIYTLKATYNGVTLQKTFKIKFNRATPTLHSIRAATSTVVGGITVPTLGTTEVNITPTAYDQYGVIIPWGNTAVNSKQYEFHFTPALNTVQGVSVDKSVYPTSKLVVNSSAVNTVLKVYVTHPDFAGITSNEVTIPITRAASYPASLATPIYEYNGIWQPPVKGGAEYSEFAVASKTIKDQYGVDITANTGLYKMEWSITGTSGTATNGGLQMSEVSINKDTGAIRVYNSAHSGNIYLSVVVKDTLSAQGTPRIRANFDGGSGANSFPVIAKVERAASRVVKLTILPKTLDHEEWAEKKLVYRTGATLAAEGENQYGETVPVEPTFASWTIESVTLKGGGTARVALDGARNVTEVFAGSSPEVKVMELQTSGKISYSNITEWDYVPTKMTVKITGTGGQITDTEVFDIIMDPPSTPSVIEVDQDYIDKNPLIIHADNTVSQLLIQATLKDQYGLELPDQSMEWSLKEVRHEGISTPTWAGVHFDPVTHYVSVDKNTAKACEIVILIKKGSVEKEAVIVAKRDNAIADSIRVNPLTTDGKLGIIYWGESDTLGSTYQFSGLILDQFDDAFGGAIEWEVDDIYYMDGAAETSYNYGSNIASFAGRTLTLKYDSAIVQKCIDGVDSYVRVKAKSVADPTITETYDVKVELAPPRPVYSEIVFTDINPSDEGSLDTPHNNPDLSQTQPPWVYLPSKGNSVTASMEGKVYDQYKRLITSSNAVKPGDNLAKISISHTGVQGLTFTYNPSTGKATAKIDSIISRDFSTFTFRTVPLNNQTATATDANIKPSRSLSIVKSADTPDELILGTVAQPIQNHESYVYEWDVPLWNTVADANVPTDPSTNMPLTGDMLSTAKYSIDAVVLNQYGSEYTSMLPSWSLPDDVHSGVESLTTVNGKKGEFRINNKTLGVDELTADTNVVASAKGDSTYEDYDLYPEMQKFPNIRIERGASYPKFMYVKGVDVEGKTEALKRPYATQVSASKIIEPQIYDQYGYLVQGISTTVDLDIPSVTSQGVAVERKVEIVPPKNKGEEPTEVLLGYLIYDSELPEPVGDGKEPDTRVLLGEYIIESKKLTIYSPCKLTEVHFDVSVDDEALSIGGKTVIVPISSEVAIPHSMTLSGNDPKLFTFKKGSKTELTEYVGTILYDQYGEEVSPNNKSVTWGLKMKDEAGNLIKYAEYKKDEDGNLIPKTIDEYLVLLDQSGREIVETGTTPSRSIVIKVRPEFFEKATELYLEAYVAIATGVAQTDPPVKVVCTIRIKAQEEGGSIQPPPPPTYYQVTYSGGEYGVIIGSALELVLGGEFAKNEPGVRNEKGWAFNGWTVDGELIKTEEYQVFDNVEFVAVYKDISKKAFVAGYDDGSIKPRKLVTRAEFVKMLVLAVGDFDPNEDYTNIYGGVFSDVQDGQWYANYIAYGRFMGIVDGYGDGTFRPNNPIQRAEAAKLVYLAVPNLVADASGEYDIDEIFSDIKGEEWFAKYVEALYYIGVIGGYTNGTFRPSNNLTRAEAVKMVVLVTEISPSDNDLERIRQYADSPFSDLSKSSWEYAYILRAAGIA